MTSYPLLHTGTGTHRVRLYFYSLTPPLVLEAAYLAASAPVDLPVGYLVLFAL